MIKETVIGTKTGIVGRPSNIGAGSGSITEEALWTMSQGVTKLAPGRGGHIGTKTGIGGGSSNIGAGSGGITAGPGVERVKKG
ncbi:MAG: hypothetical protein E4H14_03050 [Candidatus Thorarchaeota archaeon]|nr:MAG: hypothetical protein E4H14_03050 [Candidatus Thorarchaeota archaeon]